MRSCVIITAHLRNTVSGVLMSEVEEGLAVFGPIQSTLNNLELCHWSVWGGGGKMGKFMKQKSPKSSVLADNTQGFITMKQTKPRPVASAASYPITPAYIKLENLSIKKPKITLLANKGGQGVNERIFLKKHTPHLFCLGLHFGSKKDWISRSILENYG